MTTRRPTASTITDAQLDALYADRRQARASLAGTAARLQQVSAERDRLRAERDHARSIAVALEQENAALHHGEEPCPPHAYPATPSEWLWAWNRATPEQRLTGAADALIAAATLARVYGVADDMEHTTGARTWAAALREALNAPSDAATGPHSAPHTPDGPESHPSPERPTRGRTGARTDTEG